MSRHQEFMRRAIEMAWQGMRSGKGGPFGAVIVRNDEILAEGATKLLLLMTPPPTPK